MNSYSQEQKTCTVLARVGGWSHQVKPPRLLGVLLARGAAPSWWDDRINLRRGETVGSWLTGSVVTTTTSNGSVHPDQRPILVESKTCVGWGSEPRRERTEWHGVEIVT